MFNVPTMLSSKPVLPSIICLSKMNFAYLFWYRNLIYDMDINL